MQLLLPDRRVLGVDGIASQGIDSLGCELLLQRGCLLFREELLLGQALGSLDGSKGLGRPVTLEVRPAVWSAGQRPRRRPVGVAMDLTLTGGGGDRQGPDRDHRHQTGQTSMVHRTLLPHVLRRPDVAMIAHHGIVFNH